MSTIVELIQISKSFGTTKALDNVSMSITKGEVHAVVGENGAGKTKIMYSANMSYSQIQKYLNFLLTQGFIDKVEVGSPAVTYQVTESGLKLLQLINSLIAMLGLSEEDDKY